MEINQMFRNKAWAMTRSGLDSLAEKAKAAHGLDIESLTPPEAAALQTVEISEKDTPVGEIVPGKVAIISIEDELFQRDSVFARFFGCSSYEHIGSQFREALYDDSISAILFAVNSPGGEVFGCPELAEEIYLARGAKPMVAWCDGLMASAAMWLSSAVDEIYISSEAVMAGSIGVIMTHVDMTGMAEDAGLKVTHLTSGERKADLSPFVALEGKAKDIAQRTVDEYASMFLSFVQKARGRDLSRCSDASIFRGRETIEEGLVDGIMSQQEVMMRMFGFGKQKKESDSSQARGGDGMKQEDIDVMVAKAREEGKDEGFKVGHEAGVKDGVSQERARIFAIYEQGAPYPERAELVKEHMFGEQTVTPEESASALLKSGLRHEQQGVPTPDEVASNAEAGIPVEPSVKPESLPSPKGDQFDLQGLIAKHEAEGMSHADAVNKAFSELGKSM